VSNQRAYRRAGRLAFCLVPAIGAVSLLSCQSSAEKARNEMEPVYRSAKLLGEQLKAGVTLAEFNRLRGNFATELSIIGSIAESMGRIGGSSGNSWLNRWE
jgi:hypothetical protein